MDSDDDAIGALAFLARFHVAGDDDVPGRIAQDRMSDARALERDGGKAGGERRDRQHCGKRDRSSPRQERCAGRAGRQCERCNERGLALGGKVNDDAEPERDRQPGQQAAGCDVGQEPAPESVADAR